jgi:hypothetical protein
MFVSERFSVPNEAFQGVDLAWVTKPSRRQGCPQSTTFKSGVIPLADASGAAVSWGTAVRKVDRQGPGWVLAQPQATNGALLVYKITKSGAGAVVGSPKTVNVPAYSWPAQAPQAGQLPDGSPAPPLETKGYLTQAYSAFDPRLGHQDIWTAHGVAGGAGAAVRWYEINPVSAMVDQVGTIADPNLYVFNGTVAPDRLVNGTTRVFGSNMVMTFSTSSATTYPAIGIVSKRGTNPQSAISVIKASSVPNIDGNCFQTTRSACRWGDYSGTSPDPGASAANSAGQVWITNQWSVESSAEHQSAWRTLTSLAAP